MDQMDYGAVLPPSLMVFFIRWLPTDGFATRWICIRWICHQMDLLSAAAIFNTTAITLLLTTTYTWNLEIFTPPSPNQFNKKSANQTPRLQIKVYLKNAKPTPVLGSFVGGSAKIPPDSKCPIVKAKMAGKSAPTVKAELPTAVC